MSLRLEGPNLEEGQRASGLMDTETQVHCAARL